MELRPSDEPTDRATLTYYLNRLQGLDGDQPVLVTLNRDEAIDPEQVVARIDYAHPVIDQAAVAGQGQPARSLSAGAVSFCGAYWGYGFHEDGVRSALGHLRAASAHACDSALVSCAAQRTLRGHRHPPAVRARHSVQLQGGTPSPLPRRTAPTLRNVHPLVDLDPTPHRRPVAGRHAATAPRLPSIGLALTASRPCDRRRGCRRRIRARAGGDAGSRPYLGVALQSR